MAAVSSRSHLQPQRKVGLRFVNRTRLLAVLINNSKLLLIPPLKQLQSQTTRPRCRSSGRDTPSQSRPTISNNFTTLAKTSNSRPLTSQKRTSVQLLWLWHLNSSYHIRKAQVESNASLRSRHIRTIKPTLNWDVKRQFKTFAAWTGTD